MNRMLLVEQAGTEGAGGELCLASSVPSASNMTSTPLPSRLSSCVALLIYCSNSPLSLLTHEKLKTPQIMQCDQAAGAGLCLGPLPLLERAHSVLATEFSAIPTEERRTEYLYVLWHSVIIPRL